MKPLLVALVPLLGPQDGAFEPQRLALAEAFARLGVEAPPVRFLETDFDDARAFDLVVEDGEPAVHASDAAGAAQGAATLLREAELVDGVARWTDGEWSGRPDCAYRAFMVDLGRNPHPPGLLRQVVDMLWFHRANVLHLHLSDDQLFSWPSRAFPLLQSAHAGWTRDDFVELEAYAAARGVWIVPEIDVPSHSTLLRRHYPEVFGETVLDLATRPEAQHGVETLIDELLAVFASTPFVHVGGDEAYGVDEALQRAFINRLNRFVRSRGRRTVVWEGPPPGQGASKVDEDVLHVNWDTVGFPAQAMLDAGYEVVNASWDPMYVVDHYPRTMFTAVSLERCFGWDPRRFGHVDAGLPTFAAPHVTRSGDGILGFCMPWWEGRPENLLPLCLPRFAAVAEAAWNLARPGGFAAFRAGFERRLPRLEALLGTRLPELPFADPATQAGNLAFRRPVGVSTGGTQPFFSPARLTNGLTDRFDQFLGFPCLPEPLAITVALAGTPEVARVVVHETAVGASWERYRVEVSADGREWTPVGATEKGRRGAGSSVEHRFDPRPVGYVRILTDGCQDLTFPAFSRLCEIQVYGPPR